MGSVDRDEELSFKDNFSGEGVAKLREIVSEKLKEFMGDDTDDTLVEYVIVLLRNGRRKREAKTELNVFLGKDDSDSFVSWLWDHLSSTLELYVQPAEENHADKAVKTTLSTGKRAGRDESSNHIDCELEKGKTENLAGNRHRREWKGLERDPTEPPPLRSSVVVVRSEEKTHHKSSRRRKSLSPDPPQHNKRSRHEEHHMKRESVSQAVSAAPRRLLQSAVRDAVGNLRQPVVVKEPSHNHLRSVVSASSEGLPLEDPPRRRRLQSIATVPNPMASVIKAVQEAADDVRRVKSSGSVFDRSVVSASSEGLPLEDPPRRRRLQSIATVPNPMASVIKAVQEAADDVRRVKSSGSVFDRLGHGVDISETGEQVAEFRDASIAEEGYEEFNQEQAHPEFLQRIDRGGYVRNLSSMDCETGLASDLVSENEGYNVGHGAFRVSQIGTSGGSKGGDLFGVKYSASSYLDGPLPTANTSSKTVTVSSHIDARKPLHYQQDTRNATEIDISKPIQENEAEHGKSDVRLMKENGNLVVVSNGNAKPPDIQSESPKTQPSLPGSYTAGRPSEDADSRTIFVCNVHFAATKDSLSRHFNKFGEVLKVVIVTDASTGQPKGSAYVEFMRKESADNALSLDNTSFMSRILKITKRSSSNQEAPPVMTWPHVARGSPYAAARFARAPFPRGIPGAFRARAPMRMGTRSFQWKRDTQPATDDGAAVPGNTLVSPNSRGLTYVRPESKPDGSTGTT